MPPFFLDFEAFQHGKGERFQIKELCMVHTDKPYAQPIHFIFGPHKKWKNLTCEERRTYSYQMHHLHHLGWYEGVLLYHPRHVIDEMKRMFPLFRHGVTYVMGKQKFEFLQEEFPMLNLCEYNVKIKDLPQLPSNITCPYRVHGTHCACLKCYQLIEHYYELVY